MLDKIITSKEGYKQMVYLYTGDSDDTDARKKLQDISEVVSAGSKDKKEIALKFWFPIDPKWDKNQVADHFGKMTVTLCWPADNGKEYVKVKLPKIVVE